MTRGIFSRPAAVRAVKTWRAWTPGQENHLEELRLAGWTIARIAREMGHTIHGVRNKAKELGCAKARARRAEYLAAFAMPHTIAGVAAALGVSKGAVRQMKCRLRRDGLDVPAAERERSRMTNDPPMTHQ